jgi:hypothetical protein
MKVTITAEDAARIAERLEPFTRPRTRESVDFETGEAIDAWDVPHADEFHGMFLEDERLGALYEQLIEEFPELGWLEKWRVKVLWKRKGGDKGKKATLGTCQVPSGLAKFYSKADFIVLLSADHIRLRNFTEQRMKALLFHELSHCSETEEDDPQPATVGHDCEVFAAEIRHFGAWRGSIEKLRPVFRQLELQAVGESEIG